MIAPYDRPVDVEVEHGDDLVQCLSLYVSPRRIKHESIRRDIVFRVRVPEAFTNEVLKRTGRCLKENGKTLRTGPAQPPQRNMTHHALRAASFSATQNLVHLVVGITPDFHTRYFYASG
jgi:hypothetical protein